MRVLHTHFTDVWMKIASGKSTVLTDVDERVTIARSYLRYKRNISYDTWNPH